MADLCVSPQGWGQVREGRLVGGRARGGGQERYAKSDGHTKPRSGWFSSERGGDETGKES